MSDKHYVYKTIDPFNGEYYIGSRSINMDIKDDITYSGSFYSWNPEDHDRLEKEILGIYPTRKVAYSKERQLQIVALKINKDKKCMNAHIHDLGFSNYGTKFSTSHKRKLSERRKKWHENNTHPFKGKVRSKKHSENISKSLINYYKYNDNSLKGISCNVGKNNPMYGKKHTKETKEKIKQTMIKEGISRGDNNPCYGLNGEHHPASKKYRYISSGEVFNSRLECAEKCGVSKQTITEHCKNRVKKPKWEYV